MGEAIHDSVGRHGGNHRHDVIVVQLLLNNASLALGRPLKVDGHCGPLTIAAIDSYQRSHMRMAHPDGVIYPGGGTIRELLEVSTVKYNFLIEELHKIQKLLSPRHYPVANVTDVAPLSKKLDESLQSPEAYLASSRKTGHKYTDSPLEMPKIGTKVDPLLLPDLLQKAWPELNAAGARVITAQYMGETTGGKSCWSYNLGNVKCTPANRNKHLHQYLYGTWEYWAASKVEETIRTNKNARYATEAEIVKKVGKESGGKKVIFFKPPDIQTCFLAYGTLGDGVTDWTDRHKGTAKRHKDFLEKLNKGDCPGAAKIFKQENYYSQNEGSYAVAMTRNKAYLDKALGPK